MSTGLVHLGVPRLIMIYLLGVHYDQSTRTADISMGAYIACDTTLLSRAIIMCNTSSLPQQVGFKWRVYMHIHILY